MAAIRFILTSCNSEREPRSFAVLLVGDLFHPLYGFAIELLLDGDVRHGCIWRSVVPMFHSRRNPDYIALSHLLHRTSPLLKPARSIDHKKDLTEWVRMPATPRSGL